MKKLLLSGIFSLSVMAAFGQFDLAITSIISPTNGSSVTDLQQVTSKFVVENTGTTTLSTGDSIYFRNELNGTTQSYTSGGSTFNVFLEVLTKTLAPGDTVHLSITLPTAWGNAGVVAGGSFTWGFNVRGSTCCPTVDDADLTNNIMSVTLNASSSIGLDEAMVSSTDIYFSEGTLFVQGENLTSGVKNVEVFNLLGQKVYESNLNGSNFKKEFDLSHLTNGVYITTISNGNGVIASKKIMK